MATRHIFKSAPYARPNAEQAGELQVDYSYTQWRYAQMQQLEHNYHAACDAVDDAVAV